MEFLAQAFQLLRRDIDACGVKMPGGLGEVAATFAGISGSRGAMLFVTAFTTRAATMLRPHFLGMTLHALGHVVLTLAAKLLDSMLQVVGHRAAGRRAALRRRARILRSGGACEDQGSEHGNEDACIHRPMKQRIPSKVAIAAGNSSAWKCRGCQAAAM